MKIGLFGQFGTGNSGNDGSLEAMLNQLRRQCPEAEFVCICSRPELIGERYRVEARPLSNPFEKRGLLQTFDRLLWQIPRRLLDFAQAIVLMQGLDIVIVPGTGILDDFNEDAFGWPYVVLRWCLAARLGGTSFAFVSVGAGPAVNRTSRRFFRWAALLAGFRSYRDRISLEFMASLQAAPEPSLVTADIAFSLPRPDEAQDVANIERIGIGVMAYRGWQKNAANGDQIYRDYLAKMASLIDQLLALGYQVRLLTGDRTDREAVGDLLMAVRSDRKDVHLIVEPVTELGDLMRQIMRTEIVVASRYHNVVCALRMGRPVISLGYAGKNDVLLQDAGLADFCHHIETFDPAQVLQQIEIMRCNRLDLIDGVNRSVDAYLARLQHQEILLEQFLQKSKKARPVN